MEDDHVGSLRQYDWHEVALYLAQSAGAILATLSRRAVSIGLEAAMARDFSFIPPVSKDR